MAVSLVLAESALELIPKEIQNRPAVVSDSRRRGREPSLMLLDRSFHHSAMMKLKDGEKRGRPDLVHISLLAATGTPLFLEKKLRVFVHTYPDVVMEIGEGVRVPKSYLRFRGLAEKLLSESPERGLVRVYPCTMGKLVKEIVRARFVVGLSVLGEPLEPEAMARLIVGARDACIIVGGFPHGHFSRETVGVVDRMLRIHRSPLEAHVVVARVLYEVEKASIRTKD